MASANDSGGVVVEKPGWSVYTTMMLLSMIALILGCVCLWFEMEAYHWDYNAKNTKKTVSNWQPSAVQMVMTNEADQTIG